MSNEVQTVSCAGLNPTFFRPDAVGEKLYGRVVLWLNTVDMGMEEETASSHSSAVPPWLVPTLSSQFLPVIEVSSLKIVVKKVHERWIPLSTWRASPLPAPMAAQLSYWTTAATAASSPDSSNRYFTWSGRTSLLSSSMPHWGLWAQGWR